MKKYIGSIVVGLSSASFAVLCLVLLYNFNIIGNKSDGSGIITYSNNAESDFAKAVYNKNTSVNLTDFRVASAKSVNAVVSIKNYSNQSQQRGSSNPFEDFFFGFPKRDIDPDMPAGLGSGVIISDKGYIVTNNHVIDKADRVEVVLNDQTVYTADVIGSDPNTDIALLKIEADGLPFLKFVNSDLIEVGEWVLAVGNPFGLNSTVTAGIISAKARSINILSQSGDNPIESFLQTDAAINPGNSGGALVNSNGDLVGINTAISSQTGSYVGYGFAVPSNLVQKIVDDLKDYGIIQRGYIGIGGLDLSDEAIVKKYNQENKKTLKTREGVLVTKLTEKGGAEIAGIKEGDIITTVNGKLIRNFSALSLVIGSKRPGDTVAVELIRDGKVKTFSVTLRDINGGTEVRSKADLTISEILGAKFIKLSDKQKVSFGLNSGILATEVKSNGKLSSIGIRENYIILEINGQAVSSEEDAEKLIKKNNGVISIKYVDLYGRIYTRGFKMD